MTKARRQIASVRSTVTAPELNKSQVIWAFLRRSGEPNIHQPRSPSRYRTQEVAGSSPASSTVELPVLART